MKPAQPRSKLYQEFGRVKSDGEISASELPADPEKDLTRKGVTATDANYWKERLILRRYRFEASGESDQDLAAYINHADTGYFFPLGTANVEMAAAKACQIYQFAMEKGWNSVCREFTRELIVSFEWCLNPVLWTYTTIHTLVGKRSGLNSSLSRANHNRHRVLVLESDEGIRRALCWSIERQAGFISVPCNSIDLFNRT